MRLYPVTATGIRAFCSDIIVDPFDPETLYFISLCGYQATVKGIIANLLENYGISITVDDEEHYMTRASLGYKVQVRELPSGLVHAVVFPKLALPKNDENKENSFYIFTKEGDDKLMLFFRHLDEKVEIPLHPLWAEWLWRLFEAQEDWLVELKTLVGTHKGYSFNFNPKQLHDLMSDAIRNRVPEIVKCMEWKGGKGNGTFDFA
jgi:hypothetical protein